MGETTTNTTATTTDASAQAQHQAERAANEAAGATAPSVTTPELEAVVGADGKPVETIKLQNGIEATVCGKDPKTGQYILTCPDTPENRAKYPGNPKKVQEVRNSSPTVANAVQFNRNAQTPDGKGLLTITIQGKQGEPASLAELTKAAKAQNGGLMHIVDKTRENENAAQAESKKSSFWDSSKSWLDPSGWKFWAALLTTLGLATLGILAFRKGGWLNPRPHINPPVTPPSPNPEPTPDRPGIDLPENEDEWTNNNDDNTNTGNTTHIPSNVITGQGSITETLTGSATPVQDGTTSGHTSRFPSIGQDKDY